MTIICEVTLHAALLLFKEEWLTSCQKEKAEMQVYDCCVRGALQCKPYKHGMAPSFVRKNKA